MNLIVAHQMLKNPDKILILFRTKFDTNVFVRIGVPQFLIGFRVRHDWKYDVLNDGQHMRFYQFPRVCMTDTADKKKKKQLVFVSNHFFLSFHLRCFNVV